MSVLHPYSVVVVVVTVAANLTTSPAYPVVEFHNSVIRVRILYVGRCISTLLRFIFT